MRGRTNIEHASHSLLALGQRRVRGQAPWRQEAVPPSSVCPLFELSPERASERAGERGLRRIPVFSAHQQRESTPATIFTRGSSKGAPHARRGEHGTLPRDQRLS